MSEGVGEVDRLARALEQKGVRLSLASLAKLRVEASSDPADKVTVA